MGDQGEALILKGSKSRVIVLIRIRPARGLFSQETFS